MKAYLLSVANDPDQGEVLVWDTTARDAKKNWTRFLDADRFIDERVRRAPDFDNMERCTELEIMLKQWHEGWIWWDWQFPSVEDSTDDDFIKYYLEVYGGKINDPYGT